MIRRSNVFTHCISTLSPYSTLIQGTSTATTSLASTAAATSSSTIASTAAAATTADNSITLTAMELAEDGEEAIFRAHMERLAASQANSVKSAVMSEHTYNIIIRILKRAKETNDDVGDDEEKCKDASGKVLLVGNEHHCLSGNSGLVGADLSPRLKPHGGQGVSWIRFRGFQLMSFPEEGLEDVLTVPARDRGQNSEIRPKMLRVIHTGVLYDVVKGVHQITFNHGGYKRVLNYLQDRYYGVTRGYVQEFCSLCPSCRPHKRRAGTHTGTHLEQHSFDSIQSKTCPVSSHQGQQGSDRIISKALVNVSKPSPPSPPPPPPPPPPHPHPFMSSGKYSQCGRKKIVGGSSCGGGVKAGDQFLQCRGVRNLSELVMPVEVIDLKDEGDSDFKKNVHLLQYHTYHHQQQEQQQQQKQQKEQRQHHQRHHQQQQKKKQKQNQHNRHQRNALQNYWSSSDFSPKSFSAVLHNVSTVLSSSTADLSFCIQDEAVPVQGNVHWDSGAEIHKKEEEKEDEDCATTLFENPETSTRKLHPGSSGHRSRRGKRRRSRISQNCSNRTRTVNKEGHLYFVSVTENNELKEEFVETGDNEDNVSLLILSTSHATPVCHGNTDITKSEGDHRIDFRMSVSQEPSTNLTRSVQYEDIDLTGLVQQKVINLIRSVPCEDTELTGAVQSETVNLTGSVYHDTIDLTRSVQLENIDLTRSVQLDHIDLTRSVHPEPSKVAIKTNPIVNSTGPDILSADIETWNSDHQRPVLVVNVSDQNVHHAEPKPARNIRKTSTKLKPFISDESTPEFFIKLEHKDPDDIAKKVQLSRERSKCNCIRSMDENNPRLDTNQNNPGLDINQTFEVSVHDTVRFKAENLGSKNSQHLSLEEASVASDCVARIKTKAGHDFLEDKVTKKKDCRGRKDSPPEKRALRRSAEEYFLQHPSKIKEERNHDIGFDGTQTILNTSLINEQAASPINPMPDLQTKSTASSSSSSSSFSSSSSLPPPTKKIKTEVNDSDDFDRRKYLTQDLQSKRASSSSSSFSSSLSSSSKRFFQHVRVDVLDMCHCPDGHFRYIGHVVDHVSRLHVLFPLVHATVAEVAENLDRHVIAYFGMPRFLRSNRGRPFVQELLGTLLSQMAEDLVGTADHCTNRKPQKDGISDESNDDGDDGDGDDGGGGGGVDGGGGSGREKGRRREKTNILEELIAKMKSTRGLNLGCAAGAGIGDARRQPWGVPWASWLPRIMRSLNRDWYSILRTCGNPVA